MAQKTVENGIEFYDTGEDSMLDIALKLIAEMQAEEDKKKPKADSIREMRMAGLPTKRH